MATLTARAWKEFYRCERATLGAAGLAALVERAPKVELPTRGALVFPHTKLAASGELVAAVARAVVRSGCTEVLALGVLHGAREQDAAAVAAARAGDADARARLRRVHGPGIEGDEGVWGEEFSLDGFLALLPHAALAEGRAAPRVHARYPFLVGENPADLPGLDELRALVARGAGVVATTDPIHHGVGYGTPAEECLPLLSMETVAHARASIQEGFGRLARRDFAGFLAHAAAERSDFRDPGPVLATLLSGTLRSAVRDIVLVDYADALSAERPTWVAGALATFQGD